MSDISIQIKGGKNLPKIDKIYKDSSKNSIEDVIQMLGLGVERAAKISITKLSAVDTGRLRASIQSRFSGRGDRMSGIIEPNTEYQFFVHEGLGSNRAYGRRPYMEEGAKTVLDKKADEIGVEFEKLFGEVVKKVNG